MRNKVTGLAVTMLMVWFSGFHAPNVMAFFDYNTFHPLPYRPDLQEYCPQVSVSARAPKLTCYTFVLIHGTRSSKKKRKRTSHIYKYKIPFKM